MAKLYRIDFRKSGDNETTTLFCSPDMLAEGLVSTFGMARNPADGLAFSTNSIMGAFDMLHLGWGEAEDLGASVAVDLAEALAEAPAGDA